VSANKNQPHVLVLPEDDANRQLANGFHTQVGWSRTRQMQVLGVAGGWNRVLDLFESEHVTEMDRWPNRFMVLLIDFDNVGTRLQNAKARVPRHLADRVFILGVLSQPEALKADLGSYEAIGSALADECRGEVNTTWEHPLLRHNAPELGRLREHVLPILFSS
jgi:hypothetical protein